MLNSCCSSSEGTFCSLILETRLRCSDDLSDLWTCGDPGFTDGENRTCAVWWL